MRDKEAQLIWETLQKVNEADYEVPQDDDALARAKKRGYDDDTTTDTHNQYMIAQDKWNNALATLEPLDLLAARHGGEDINPAGGNIKGGNIIDWLAKQIEDQGQNWVDWFEQQVMTEE